MFPTTSHGNGPLSEGTSEDSPPTPAQCRYSRPGWHDPFPQDQPAGAAAGLASGHPAGATGIPAGRRLVRPPRPCPHRAARQTERVSLSRPPPQSEGTENKGDLLPWSQGRRGQPRTSSSESLNPLHDWGLPSKFFFLYMVSLVKYS